MPHVTRLRVVGAAVAAGALTLGSLATATAAQAANPRKAIAHTHPSWAVAAKRLSSTASGTVSARVYLAPNHASSLAGAVAAVSDPRSSSYRHFRSAASVRAEFAPTSAEVASVRSWLTSSGLSVTQVRASNPAGAFIAVRGSVAAASKAFGVSFGTYRGPGGQAARAPEQAATAPASVAGSVLAVAGLDTAKSQIKPALPPPPPQLLGRPAVLDLLRPEGGDQQAQGLRQAPAVDQLRLHPGSGARRLRGCPVRQDRPGPDGRDRGRLRVADHQGGRQQVRHRDRRPAVRCRASSSSTRPGRTRWPGRTSATRRAGTARKPSTSSPCMAWRRTPTSGTSALAAARTRICSRRWR